MKLTEGILDEPVTQVLQEVQRLLEVSVGKV